MSNTRRNFFKMLTGTAVAAVVPKPVYQIGIDWAGQEPEIDRYVLIATSQGRIVMHSITHKAGELIQFKRLLSEVGGSHE